MLTLWRIMERTVNAAWATCSNRVFLTKLTLTLWRILERMQKSARGTSRVKAFCLTGYRREKDIQ